MLLNSSQSAVAIYRYDPYGNTTASSGTLAGANLQRFSSKTALDVPSMALYYYGERFYAPDLQRWLNKDPIGEGGGENLYCFCWNAPSERVDASGRFAFVPWLMRGAARKTAGQITVGGKAFGPCSLVSIADVPADSPEHAGEQACIWRCLMGEVDEYMKAVSVVTWKLPCTRCPDPVPPDWAPGAKEWPNLGILPGPYQPPDWGDDLWE